MSIKKDGITGRYFDMLDEVYEALEREATREGRANKDQLHFILIERYNLNINLDGTRKSRERELTRRSPRAGGKRKNGSKD